VAQALQETKTQVNREHKADRLPVGMPLRGSVSE
jgi:hypothetical protein